MTEANEIMEVSILEGYRTPARQKELYDAGKSKVKAGGSKHNVMPSQAVDVAPYPLDWDDRGRFYIFAGVVKAIASKYGVKMRYGGDWDGDGRTTDQTFYDLGHFEIVQ
jgi:peptidoglycan L-alanyl-D-glutamate endopeptidase CwlK